jgi:hypothetical protein
MAASASRPTISALTSRDRVLEAIHHYDELGGEKFRDRYGYGRALRYRLRYKRKLYDSKAIAGVAWGLQHFDDPFERPGSFKGGARSSVPTLERLGFTIEVDGDLATNEQGSGVAAPPLTPGRTYTWEELGKTFQFPPDYLGLAGGMISRPEQNSLMLITHGEGEGAFYGDKWDGKDLIYAGRGLTGDQELKGQNRQVAENSRQLYLFEAGGSRKLFFHGMVRCVDYWESTGFDKNKKERRVYRFRLAPVGTRRAAKRRRGSGATSGPGMARKPSSFQPRPFDPDRTPAERRRQRSPGDPESQRVLAEQADQAHQEILKTAGLWLQARGWTDLEEVDAAVDLQGRLPDKSGRVLFEIKSIRPQSERTQVRSGLAQLLEYRLFLGLEADQLCLVSDRPISEQRLQLLDSLSIAHLYIERGETYVSGTRASRSLFPRAI